MVREGDRVDVLGGGVVRTVFWQNNRQRAMVQCDRGDLVDVDAMSLVALPSLDPLVIYACTIASAEGNVVEHGAPNDDHCIAALAAALRDERAKFAHAAETLRAIGALVGPL